MTEPPPTLVIFDRGMVPHPYTVETFPGGLRLTHQETGDTYTVRRGECSCPAFRFRNPTKRPCKHLERLQEEYPMPEVPPTHTPAHPEDFKAVEAALAAPFDGREVKWKPGVVAGSRCLALPYVDARVIQDRLDEVVGVLGWQDSYECLPDGAVVCRLRIRLGSEWVTKMDVGSPSEQPDEGDRRKAAFSDALKRAAVKFGIGRHLYRIEPQWVDYDPQKKRITGTPRLPGHPHAAPKANGDHHKPPPADGPELDRRVRAGDAALAKEGRIKAGDLIGHVSSWGLRNGYVVDVSRWSPEAVGRAWAEVKSFMAGLKTAPQPVQ